MRLPRDVAHLLLAAVALLLAPAAAAQFSGTYTLDPNKPSTRTNFQSFGEAAFTLEDQGVSGPVTIEVVPEEYAERVTIPAIPGASATSRVTIIGEGEGGDRPIIRFATDSRTDWVVRIESSFVSLINLLIQNAEADDDSGTIVHIGPRTEQVEVEACEIIGLQPSRVGANAYGILSETFDVRVTRTTVLGNAVGIGAMLSGGSHVPDYARGLSANTIQAFGTAGIRLSRLPQHRSETFPRGGQWD